MIPILDVWRCEACGYDLRQVNALESMRGPMLNAFSDPVALAEIMARQHRERLAAAITKHRKECSGHAAT